MKEHTNNMVKRRDTTLSKIWISLIKKVKPTFFEINTGLTGNTRKIASGHTIQIIIYF